MKKTLIVLLILTLPLAASAQKLSLSIGGYAGLDIPIIQDDQGSGTIIGFKGGWQALNLITIEPNISFTKFGDPDFSDVPGLFEGLEGSKVTYFGVNGILGGTKGSMGLSPYLFFGIGSYTIKRDQLSQDDTEIGYNGGLGIEIGLTPNISLDARGRFTVIPINDISKKSAALTAGVNYYLGK